MEFQIKGFSFYNSYWKAIRHLKSVQSQKDLCFALCKYAFEGDSDDEVDAVNDVVLMALELIKPNIDTSISRSKSGSKKDTDNDNKDKGRTNGNQNGNKMKSKRNQNGNDNDNDNDNDNEDGTVDPLVSNSLPPDKAKSPLPAWQREAKKVSKQSEFDSLSPDDYFYLQDYELCRIKQKQFVTLTEKHGKENARLCMQKLHNYIANNTKGRKYIDHYGAINMWANREVKKDNMVEQKADYYADKKAQEQSKTKGWSAGEQAVDFSKYEWE